MKFEIDERKEFIREINRLEDMLYRACAGIVESCSNSCLKEIDQDIVEWYEKKDSE